MTKKEIESMIYDSVIKYGKGYLIDVIKLDLPQSIKIKLVGKKDEIEIDSLACCYNGRYKTVFYRQKGIVAISDYFDKISINSQNKILKYINENFKK